MEKFTASNGSKVVPFIAPGVDDGVEVLPKIGKGVKLFSDDAAALRECFLHERDQELGRWRWPENPDYVVYPDQARKYIEQPAVIVVNERDGAVAYCGKDGAYSASGIGASDDWCEPAARAYFAAHPEPKPWHAAKPGEVWELTYLPLGEKARTRPFGVDMSGKFRTTQGVRVAPFIEIIGARRIWPEVSDE